MSHPRPLLRLDIAPWRDRRLASSLMLSLGLAASMALPAGAQSTGPDGGVDIVVTTAVLGSVIRDLVGDRATVTVLMGTGVDPHDWSPSAQDIEAVYGADLVIANGLGLEEGLHDALQEAAANGVRVVEATDHITLRALGASEPGASGAPGASADHGPLDPHFWVDPLSMRAVVDAVVPVIGELGVDVSDRGADLDGRLDALDAEVRTTLEAIPAERRKLVTGHESMGYFADRYGFALIGTVIPGLSSQGEVSARELAQVAERIRAEGVSVIFTEIGTPQSVVDAIAGETGVAVVALPSHNLPDDGSYFTFIRDIAGAVAGALS
jgi:zinc/manganese transport system substrate-binding protein